MHKRKDEIRDIYQSQDRDFEKDFTPQVAQEHLEDQKRDLRRSRVFSILFGVLAIILSIVLASLVIRNALYERAPARKSLAAETPYSPPSSPEPDDFWVMDFQQALPQTSPDNPSGPKPISTEWVKKAASHIIMGQQFMALNQLKEALDHFKNVVDIYPDIEGLHQAMGVLSFQIGDYSNAAVHLEKALQEEETFDTVNNLGAAYLEQGKYDQAEKYLTRALELRPENPGCHRNLAELYRKMKLDDKAAYHFEKYLDLQPNDLDTLQTYALYLTELGRWKEASVFLTKLTQGVTDVAPLYFLLAQAQIQNGQQDKAIDALKRGIQLVDPQLALTWMGRKEFDTIRDTSNFKTLVAGLEHTPETPKEEPSGSAVP